MHKLKKNIATAVALAMVISGFAPTAEAYSINNNSNNSIFSRMMKALKANNAEISFVRFEDKSFGGTIPSTSTKVKISVFGSNMDTADLGVQIESNGKVIDIPESNLEITDKKSTKLDLNLTIPENDSKDDRKCTIKFCTDKSNPVYSGETLTLNQEGKKGNEAVLTGFTSNKTTLTEAGGKVSFYVDGTNLDSGNYSLEIKNDSDRVVTEQLIPLNKNVFMGTKTKKVLTVNFPAVEFNNPSIKEKVYNVNLKSNGVSIGKNIKITFKKEEINSLIKGVTPKEVAVESNAQTVEFTLKTDANIENKNIKFKVLCDGIFSPITPTMEGVGEERKGKIAIPENKSTKEKVYTVQFADSTNMNFTDKIKLTINQKVNSSTSSIQNIIPPVDGTKIPKEGKKIEFRVNAPNVSKDKLGVKVSSEEKELEIKGLNITGEGNIKTISMTLPENEEQKVKTYKIELCIDKNKPNYEGNPSLIITQDAAEAPKEIKISSFEATKADLPKDGGTTKITTKGENLNKKRLTLKVEKILSDNKKEDISDKIGGIKDGFFGTENLMSADLTFPKVDNINEIDRYEVSLLVNGAIKFTDEVTVSKYGTLADTTDFGLAGVYMDGSNKIILQSEENMYEIMPNSLKENISLKIVTDKKEEKPEASTKATKEGFVKLSDEDKVELKDNFITITLKNPIDIDNLDVSQSKVRIEKRVLKNSEGLPFGELEYRINKDIPVVHEYEFVSGEILDSKGGEVAVKLKGINLVNPGETAEKEGNPRATRVKVFKKEKLNSAIQYLKDVKVEGSGNEQIIRFNLPANKSKRTKSYTVKISLDNGKTYSPEVGVNMLDSRGTRISPSVLPEGKTANDPTLGFASIQSYGTSGGGEAPDNTHTNTPTNQESKKTFVHLYGTNLRKDTTKVRIIHKETGAVFVPTHEPAKDSGDRFIMVGFDGTGIIGDGNHQQLEIIAPRGYVGDNTWIYQFAIDGVNYDQEVTVSATVVDDKEDGGTRPDPKEAIRTLVVKYLTADGKEVAKQEEHKVFKGQQFYSSDIAPKEIKGYKYLGVKEVKEAKSRLEALNNKTSLTEAEKAEKAKLENLFNNVVNQKFKELEMTYTNKPGAEGVLTFLYEDATPSKPVEPSIPSVPSVPEKPQEEEKPEEKPGEGVKVEVVDKIAGETRYDTSVDISKKVYSTSEKVYLVSGEKFPDALSSAALAGKGDGPILLINDKNVDKILSEINRLGAKEIVFIGGNSISKANEDKIKAFAEEKTIVVSAIIGKNRYETAIKVAEETIAKRGNKGKVIIADGRNYPDAVSIAPYASKEGIPVILVNGNNVPKEVKDFLSKYKIKDAIVVGGTNAVGKDVEKLFKKVDRVAGEDRYKTSKKIADKFFADSSTVFIASGESFADSLSVSYYAGKQTAPVILTKANSLDNDTRDYLNANKDKNYIIIGGDKAINPNLFK